MKWWMWIIIIPVGVIVFLYVWKPTRPFVQMAGTLLNTWMNMDWLRSSFSGMFQ